MLVLVLTQVCGANSISRAPGTKLDLLVYGPPGEYASFPQLIRTEKDLLLFFTTQNLEKLKATEKHPHYLPAAEPRWATSTDGGLTWEVSSKHPKLNKVLDSSYAAPLNDGGLVSVSYESETLFSITQRHELLHYPMRDGLEYVADADQGPATVETRPLQGLQQYAPFYRYDVARLSNGSVVAAGYPKLHNADGTRTKYTLVLLETSDEGKSWRYLSTIPNPYEFSFGEPCIVEVGEGKLVAVLRACFSDDSSDRPQDAPREHWRSYGYYMYQAESDDYGRTWSTPRRIYLWGHPAQMRVLKSGNIMMVFGARRDPYSVMAVLSRDGAKTWDFSTLKTVNDWDSVGFDVGYPVITQNDDGSIVCAYYGYTSADGSTYSPHGVFVSVFDEKWMLGE